MGTQSAPRCPPRVLSAHSIWGSTIRPQRSEGRIGPHRRSRWRGRCPEDQRSEPTGSLRPSGSIPRSVTCCSGPPPEGRSSRCQPTRGFEPSRAPYFLVDPPGRGLEPGLFALLARSPGLSLAAPALPRRASTTQVSAHSRVRAPYLFRHNKRAPQRGPFCCGGADGARTRDFQRDRLAL